MQCCSFLSLALLPPLLLFVLLLKTACLAETLVCIKCHVVYHVNGLLLVRWLLGQMVGDAGCCAHAASCPTPPLHVRGPMLAFSSSDGWFLRPASAFASELPGSVVWAPTWLQDAVASHLCVCAVCMFTCCAACWLGGWLPVGVRWSQAPPACMHGRARESRLPMRAGRGGGDMT